jgi:hypothetical protein
MTQTDATGKRFTNTRRWLDISHRAIGRLAREDGIDIHESLWATWEQREHMIHDESRVLRVVEAIAKRLDGEPEKMTQTIFNYLKGERDLPKKPAVWRPGAKPVLVRGRRPGVPQPRGEATPASSDELRAIQQLATDVAVDAATTGTKLPEKVAKLIQAILSGSAKKAFGAVALAIGLAGSGLAATDVSSSAYGGRLSETSMPYPKDREDDEENDNDVTLSESDASASGSDRLIPSVTERIIAPDSRRGRTAKRRCSLSVQQLATAVRVKQGR